MILYLLLKDFTIIIIKAYIDIMSQVANISWEWILKISWLNYPGQDIQWPLSFVCVNALTSQSTISQSCHDDFSFS